MSFAYTSSKRLADLEAADLTFVAVELFERVNGFPIEFSDFNQTFFYFDTG